MKRASSLSPCLLQVLELHDDDELKKNIGKGGEASSSIAVSTDTVEIRNDDVGKGVDRTIPGVIKFTLKSTREDDEEIKDGCAPVSRVSLDETESVRRKLSRIGKKFVSAFSA
jgi:hypothetical protein